MKRLILFDIDETMISSDGAGRRALSRVLKEELQVDPKHTNIVMSGKTDPQILTEILTSHEMPAQEIPAAVTKLIEMYLETLEEEISASKYYIMHEGVNQLLEAIANEPAMYIGLLTGNVERGARMKLAHFDLNKHFTFGAYGSDSADRLELPAVAAKRAQELFGTAFTPQEIVIIGDATNDVRRAKGYGAKSIAVNTGKTSWQDLAEQKPDYLFKSLANTEEIMDAIRAPMPATSSQAL